MSILVNKDTRLLVQGITGREGAFHTEQMIEYYRNMDRNWELTADIADRKDFVENQRSRTGRPARCRFEPAHSRIPIIKL